MLKKIVISGCSITAGTELWEEQYVPGYANMVPPYTKRIQRTVPDEEIIDYNQKNSYPSLIGNILQIPIENISQRGISNKEIAMRTLLHFPNDHYEDTIAIIQITTHNRMLLNYSETQVGSVVLQPTHPIWFLNKNQNNILQEYFLEFFNESVTMQEDYMSILYAMHHLKSKNIPCYLLRISPSKLNQPLDEPHFKFSDNLKMEHPQSSFNLTNVESILLKEFNKFSLTDKSLEEITNAGYLPHYHFSHKSQKLISEHLSEKIKCLHF